MQKVVLFLILGAVGGLIGWAVLEPTPLTAHGERTLQQLYLEDAIFGFIMGFFIGGMLSLGWAMWQGKSIRGFILWGASMGGLGGAMGLVVGERFFQALAPREGMSSLVLGFQQVVARAIGWALIGGIVGAVQGIPTRSGWRARNGFIGGLIGGFIGGLSFDFLAILLFTDVISRLVALTVIGALVGMSTAFVEEVAKQAWLKVLVGRGEGRDYIIDKAEFSIGRDELCDLGLFGDRSILPRHAVIKRSDGVYTIQSLGGEVMLNGQRIVSASLRHGDRLQIGKFTLVFETKARAVRKDVAVPPPVLPQDSEICPFCGQRRDPVTGACACTPTPALPVSPIPATAPTTATASLPKTIRGVKLVGIDGPVAGQVFPITKKEVTIGRAEDRDIRIEDKVVSRRHCKIVEEEDGFYLIDENSTNGTFIGNMRIAREKLKEGDLIRIGESLLRFEM